MRIARYRFTERFTGLTSSTLGRLLASAVLLVSLGPAHAFDLGDVISQAQHLARQPYQANKTTVPAELKALSDDRFSEIQFKPERALWRKDKLPFELMFYPVGRSHTEPVQINEIDEQGKLRHVAFDPKGFDYGKNHLSPQTWGDVGYAGFRVHYPINDPQYKAEMLVFMGASYFRVVGAGQRYGLSARGLGIDTSVGGDGEEFPHFSRFWIEKPKANATGLVIYALLESRRATGAYRFVVKPGTETVVDVKSQVYLRSAVGTLGVAPLTSMFMFGENQPHRPDYRPKIHDSDGLMIANGDGEWLWRPLINPGRPLTTSFAMKSLRGFGLMQRDRTFASYQDLDARYELRPSAWITPQGNWGPGRIELHLFNTLDETNDNVGAYWVPDKPPAPGQPLTLSYQIRWQGEQQQRPPGAWVTQTRVGRGFDELAPNETQYVIDFKGPALDTLPADAVVKAVITADANGEITQRDAYRNEADGTWRMTLRVKQIKSTQPVELRAFLQHEHDTVSETWTNLIPSQ